MAIKSFKICPSKGISITILVLFCLFNSNIAHAARLNPLGQTIPCLDKKTKKIMLKGKVIGDYNTKIDLPKTKSASHLKLSKTKEISNPPKAEYATCPPPPFDPDKVVGFGARGRAKYGRNAAVEIYTMRAVKPQETHPFFVNWLFAHPDKFQLGNQYLAYLNSQGVGNVVPTRELMMGCMINPNRPDLLYDVPPKQYWPNIVPTLRFLKDHVIPAIGPVRLYHGYRSPAANAACGSTSDAHPNNTAIDIVPLKMDSPALIERKMCQVFRQHGRKYNVGIGFYGTGLLHIDSWKARSWGGDKTATTSPCLL